jgi:hypothetical protein
MPTYTWMFEDADGSPLTPQDVPAQGFPTQADAESWVGESWHDGPMSLRPAE